MGVLLIDVVLPAQSPVLTLATSGAGVGSVAVGPAKDARVSAWRPKVLWWKRM